MEDSTNLELSEEELIRQLNEQLISIGASSAEQSFGLAIWLGTLPILGIVAILLALRIINIILAFFLVIIFLLVLVAATAILATKARQNAVQHAIQQKTLPYLRHYQASHRIDLATFTSKAREILTDEAPFLQALSLMNSSVESDETHD